MIIDVLLYSPLVIIPLQIALCLTKCHRFWKLVPLIVGTILLVTCFIKGTVMDGWTGFGYCIITFFLIPPVAACGLGWLIAFVIRKIYRSKNSTRQDL